jgi:hypothetical protein
LRKIEYVGGGNGQPNADGSATPDNGSANLQVFLDGTPSSDPDGDTLSYLWELGHGPSKTTATVNHSYPQGVYEATLTVDDGNGGVDVTRPIRIVSGNNRPTATVTTPADESTYTAGLTIAYSGTGDDVEDSTLACSAFTWTFIFHHDDHTHPFVGPIQGICGGTVDIPLGGEPDPNQWYEVRLAVEDDGTPFGAIGKLTHIQSIEVRPEIGQMTFESSPKPDLQLSLDTVPFTAPMIVDGVVNMQRTIGAADQAGDDGHTYVFDSWSDSGAPQHPINTPSGNSTFTANFVCDMQEAVRAVAVSHNQSDGSITITWPPVSDICLDTGSTKYAVYATGDPEPPIGSGTFPSDPAFNLVGYADTESFNYVPGANDNYFLIIAIGSNGGNGPSGHYGD